MFDIPCRNSKRHYYSVYEISHAQCGTRVYDFHEPKNWFMTNYSIGTYPKNVQVDSQIKNNFCFVIMHTCDETNGVFSCMCFV